MKIGANETLDAEGLLRLGRERHAEGKQDRRVLITEAIAAMVFLAGAGALALSAQTRPLSLATLEVTVLTYLVAAKVRFPVGSAWTAPTQLVFVPMLFVLPTALVPLIVAACSVVDLWPQLLRRRLSWGRVFARVADSSYSLGPALVLVLAGEQVFSWERWPLFVLAFGAQVVGDSTAGLLRTWFAERVRPTAQLPMVWLYVTDACLSCVGLVIAASAVGLPGLVLIALPLIGLLSLFAHERQQRFEQTLALGTAYRGTALLLGDVIDAADHDTAIHSREVVDLALELADALRLETSRRGNLELAALLHDVGKIRVPPAIISKPGRLDADEWEIMRRHTLDGETMLRQVGGNLSTIGGFVRSCHEHYDGQGYPDGLGGEAIPIESRIVSVCDAYHAMTTDRPYRTAQPASEALAELRRCAGSQFDPAVVGAMSDVMSAISPQLQRRARMGEADPTSGPLAGRDPPDCATPREQGRAPAARARDQARIRDKVAAARDLAAAQRDRLAASRDERARSDFGGGAPAAAGEREDAARDREHAARDREHAAGDREHAARDRDVAVTALKSLTLDELTKTRRRGPGLDELKREIDRARRTGQQLAVAYVDVDGLKAINDTKGHAAGDELLQSITDALRSDLRSYDLIIRLGGDEFLCVLPGARIDDARAALDHVRDWILESTEGGSISVGLADLEPQDSCEELIARADANLIANRRHGSGRDYSPS